MDRDAKTSAGTLLLVLAIGAFIGFSVGGNNRGKVEAAIGQCGVVRDDYQAELERAADNISNANDQIDDAKSYAWSSYDEMGNALDNLEEIETPDDPGTSCY